MHELFALSTVLAWLCAWAVTITGFLIALRRILPLVQAIQEAPGLLDRPASLHEFIVRCSLLCRSLTGRLGSLPRLIPGIGHILVVFSFVVTIPYTVYAIGAELFPLLPHYAPSGGVRLLLACGAFSGFLGAIILALYSTTKQTSENKRIRHALSGKDGTLLFRPEASVNLLYDIWSGYAVPILVVAIVVTVLGSLAYGGFAWRLGHLVAFWGFVAFWPASSHTHLLAAPVSLLGVNRSGVRHMRLTDFSDEDAESFGLGMAEMLPLSDVVQTFSCTNCRRCEEACPAFQAGLPLSPRHAVIAARYAWQKQACAPAEPSALVEPFPEEAATDHCLDQLEQAAKQGVFTPRALWACTTCRACEDACSVGIRHLDILLEERKYQVLTLAEAPEGINRFFSNMEQTGTPFGLGDAPLPDSSVPAQEQKLVFAGALSRTHPEARKGLTALRELIARAGWHPVAVDKPGSRLETGEDIRRAGNEYLGREYMDTLAALLDGVDEEILTPCPHALHAFRNEFPEIGVRIKAEHHSAFVLRCVQDGRLVPQDMPPLNIVYHDPCYLGRQLGEFEVPRELVRLANGGRKVLVLRESKRYSICCGGGGGMLFTEETGLPLARKRLDMLLAHEPDLILTACPTCRIMLSEAWKEVRASGKSVPPIADLAEFCLERCFPNKKA